MVLTWYVHHSLGGDINIMPNFGFLYSRLGLSRYTSISMYNLNRFRIIMLLY